MYIRMYVCMYVCMYICICIYIYIEREREGEWGRLQSGALELLNQEAPRIGHVRQRIRFLCACESKVRSLSEWWEVAHVLHATHYIWILGFICGCQTNLTCRGERLKRISNAYLAHTTPVLVTYLCLSLSA